MFMLALVLTSGALCRAALAQDSVVLREWAELPAAGPVTLGLIAELSGEQAAALASVEIPLTAARPSPDGWLTVDLASVRSAVRAVPGVNWGRLVVRGSTCDVRRAAPVPATVGSNPSGQRAEAASGPTVRDVIEQRLRDAYAPDGAEIRFEFDESDAALLGAPVSGRTADVQLIGTSERQTVSVRLFEGLGQALSGTARVGVSVERDVAVCTVPLRRGEPILAENMTTERRWISPTVRAIEPGRAVGRVARGRIDAGSVITEADAEAPLLVKKGDLVDVYCLSGSINLKSIARALENGREGEVVRFQNPGASRHFTARVDGPRRAVTAVGALPGGPEEPARADGAGAADTGKPETPESRADSRTRRVRYINLGDRAVDRAPGPRKESSR